MCIVCDMKAAGASAEVLAMAENLNMIAHELITMHGRINGANPGLYSESQKANLKRISDELRGNEINATKAALEAVGLTVMIVDMPTDGKTVH